MVSKIEEIIQDIEEYIDSCRTIPLANDYIKVNKMELEDKLRELKMKTPEEIKTYQKVIQKRQAILADAEAKAASIVETANVHKKELISEHQIMQQAYAQANEIVQLAQKEAEAILNNATSDANDIRTGAIQYTDELLGNLENIIGHTMDTAGAKYESFITSLRKCYDIVESNRVELNPPIEDQQAAPASEQQVEAEIENYRVDVTDVLE